VECIFTWYWVADLCAKEVLLVLDIGAHSTSINFLLHGQPVMTRIAQFGGDLVSEYIAQVLTLQPEIAEEEKLKMSETVQPLIRQSISPLVQEIRSSIDFFERQHECHVTRLFACGGSACSSPPPAGSPWAIRLTDIPKGDRISAR
jgi:Tfp pilus assembly PilM family ATPase